MQAEQHALGCHGIGDEIIQRRWINRTMMRQWLELGYPRRYRSRLGVIVEELGIWCGRSEGKRTTCLRRDAEVKAPREESGEQDVTNVIPCQP